MSEPFYDPTNDRLIIYDNQTNADRSGYLRIKYLLLHVPSDPKVKILSILIFEGMKLVLNQTDPQYYAFIYTEGLSKSFVS
jgi:hypothetical protein